LTFGRRRICCTPGRADAGGSWYAGGSLEARMYVGVPDISAGSGGIWTKWRISRRLSEELFVLLELHAIIPCKCLAEDASWVVKEGFEAACWYQARS
jgi:hypothetical protein